MTGKTYHLVINGRPEGPFSVEELRERAVNGDDFVRTAGMDDYKQVSEIRDLAEALALNYKGTEPQYFAGIDQRMLASALDWLLMLGVWILAAIVIVLVTGNDRQKQFVALGTWFALLLPARTVYQIVMENSGRQATWGKRALSIRVTDERGRKPAQKQVIGRNLYKIVSTIPFFAGYFVGFFNAKNQCLHDGLAGTLVIKDRLV